MVFAGERCFKYHRFMFIIMGLWPYQKPFIWRLQTIFFSSVHFCSLLSQLMTFLTMIYNMDSFLKRFSYICITLVYILNYYSFYFNSELIKQSLKHMQFDWKMYANAEYLKIFEEYLFESYILALIASNIFIFIGLFVFVFFECRTVILDIIIPMNVSRPHKLEVDFEFFVDKQRYFLLYFIQEMLGVGIGVCSIISTGTFLITIGKHFCAMYKIASNLIQNMASLHALQIPAAQKMQFMQRNIRLSVHIHRRTLEFCKYLLITFNMWYFPLLLICVVSLSCIFFRLHNAVRQLNDFYDVFISCVILYCYLMYMFVANFLAQSYTDHSIALLESTYSLWYLMPLPIQKLFLIMQKSINNHRIVMGGLFVLSIEGFSSLITSAISYFTVMHAMRS
ncbi:hypothetical protein HN011_006027 [Eciton burchellii]|nr:hypothetical protein HN011_006027 [Eciton burchellii]